MSTDPNCPLYLVELVYKNPGEPYEYFSSNRAQLSMETWGTNANFNLKIESTSSFYWETYYLRGSS